MKLRYLVAGSLVVLVVLGFILFSRINAVQRDGRITLNALKAPARVVRDEKGMPYIYARSLADGITALGFVTAQDRLTQLTGVRLMSSGRLAEVAGDAFLKQDILFRSLGFLRNARKHAAMLDSASRRILQWYVNGINGYIRTMGAEYPLELRLGKIAVEPWDVADALATLYMVGFSSSGNYKSELLFAKLSQKLGFADAAALCPVNVGPDGRPVSAAGPAMNQSSDLRGLGEAVLPPQASFGQPFCRVGSNNWVIGPKLTGSGHALLAGDPHLISNRIPGAWYPAGIITPDHRMVGTTIPGSPAFYNLRNEHIAMGLTNSYLDCQDLYVERLDPRNAGHYLEGSASIPFRVIRETYKIKDKTAPAGYREISAPVLLSKRGPVIFKNDKIAMTLRWSAMAAMTPTLSIPDVLRARSVADLKEALAKETIHFFNRSFVDAQGNIGWHTTGRIPLRTPSGGAWPRPAGDGTDNWTGWIPFDQMPHAYNPAVGWIGNANNRTVGADYPHYLSSQFASHYRFERLRELLEGTGPATVDAQWAHQRDTRNMLAVTLAPIMAGALNAFDDTRALGQMLDQWDYHDDKDKRAPALFQILLTHAAYLTYKDELGEALAKEMLDDWYFWLVRFERMVVAGKSRWFDNRDTDQVETLRDILHLAGRDALARYGDIPEWGALHRIEFLNALISQGPLKSFVGGGTYAMSGSGETLYRSKYSFNQPFDITITASLRWVADMADREKVLAVLPGGVSGRILDRHYKDQTDAFMNGGRLYWWFSDEMIRTHTRSTLMLNP